MTWSGAAGENPVDLAIADSDVDGLADLAIASHEADHVTLLSVSDPEARRLASEITALDHRLDKTRAIKQGMIQQLLTGSIRLPIPDDDTEDDDAHDA